VLIALISKHPPANQSGKYDGGSEGEAAVYLHG
jgi:hypothetical protein